MTIRLVHGFNVWDGGRNTIDRLKPYLPPPIVEHDYGPVLLLGLRCRNAQTVRDIGQALTPGSVLIGHSNGALICWEVARRYPHKVAGVVTINAAMRRDTQWPSYMPVLNLYNPKDWAVLLGRIWSRLTSLGGLTPHGWGAAGRYGFTADQDHVQNLCTTGAQWEHQASRHSGVFAKDGNARQWGGLVGMWIATLEGTDL